MTRSERLMALRGMIDSAENIVIFTGAGVSTESGIPDFRSPGTGLWTKIKPVEFSEFVSAAETRKKSWERKFNGQDTMAKATPNRGHRAIAHLMDLGKASVVVTQNVDNLHQASGIADEKVLELHGNANFAKCLTCDERYELDDLEQQFRSEGEVQPCEICGGIIKTATISFGQALPQDVLMYAVYASEHCDLFIVIGSSLQVYPAASLPELAKRSGAQLAILNRDPTPLDVVADLVVNDEIGPTLGEVVGVN